MEESSWISMPDVRRMKTKLVLMGEGGVGKTSLVRRFVLNEYQDTYLHTVGTRVNKIELTIPHGADTEVQMDMAIFDIMGQKGFRDLVRETYYHGAQALMAVCDLTQKDSLSALDDWIPRALEITGDVPLYLVVNKKDLEAQRAFSDEEIRQAAETFAAPYVLTSALTGELSRTRSMPSPSKWSLGRFVKRTRERWSAACVRRLSSFWTNAVRSG